MVRFSEVTMRGGHEIKRGKATDLDKPEELVSPRRPVRGSSMSFSARCASTWLEVLLHTAEKEDAETPLPHINAPLSTAHGPLDVCRVKLLAEPENV